MTRRIVSVLLVLSTLVAPLIAQNVGVNINNPAFTLDVRGTDDTNFGGELQLSTPSQTNFLRLFGGRLGDPNPFMAFHDMDTFHLVSTSADFSTYERKMTVYPSGEIGMGTDKPDGSLHVVGGSSIPFPTLRLTDTLDNFARIKMETTLGGDRFWDIAASSTPGFSLLNFYFQNDTAAQNLFSIQETTGAIVQRSFTNNSLHLFYNNAGQQGYHGFLGDNYYVYNTAYDGDLRFHTRGFARMIIDTLGYVGIRNIAPRAELDISTYSTDDGSSLYMGNQDDSHFLRMFSGRENLSTPLIYWKHGDVMQLGMANADDTGYTPFLSFDGKTIGVHNTGQSIFIGEDAGVADNGVNNYNIAIGHEAMKHHVHGQANIAIGQFALRFDTVGVQNVAIGSGAMYSSKYSFYNTAIGHSALSGADNVGSNTAVGYLAMYSLKSGLGNTALGNWALAGDTVSFNNTAIGVSAMSYPHNGYENVAVGGGSMRYAYGHRNTVVGYQAGAGDTTNFWGNVLLGYQAGKNNTESNRLFIENSDSNTPLIYGEFNNDLVRINGDQEVTGDFEVDGSTFYVDEGSNEVGVRTNTPSYPLDVAGQLNLNKNITSGVAMRINGQEVLWSDGDYFSYGFGTGHNYFAKPVRIGPAEGANNPFADLHVLNNSGNSNITVESYSGDAILHLAGSTNNPGDFWTIRRDVSASGNLVWQHGGFHRMTFTTGGNLGIGMSSPTYQLHLSSNSAGKPGGGSWTNSSDRRLKQNINTYTDGLDQVMQIKPVTFQYNDKSGYDSDPEYVGVIAQELQEVAPYMVSEGEKGFLDVDNSAMMYMLINAVQEQQQMIEQLQAEIKSLRSK